MLNLFARLNRWLAPSPATIKEFEDAIEAIRAQDRGDEPNCSRPAPTSRPLKREPGVVTDLA